MAILLALVGIIIVVLAGASVDYGRAWYVKNQLQMAADAAVVAAAATALSEKASSVPDKAAIEKMARDVFLLNNRLAPNAVVVAPPSPVYDSAKDTITLNVNAIMRASFVFMVGVSDISINLVAVSQRPRPGPLELVMALDTTNSMNDKPADGSDPTLKLAAMKSAATKLVDALITPSTQGSVRIGIVPYNAYANVMPQSSVPAWVKAPANRTVTNPCAQWSYPPIPKCTPGFYSCTVDGFWKINGCYRTCLDTTKPSCVKTIPEYTYTWLGCTGTRVGTRTLTTTGSDGKPVTQTLKLDEVLDAPTVFTYPGWRNDQVSCINPIMDLSADAKVIKDKITSLTAYYDTFLPSGLVWAWNVLTPGEPYNTTLSDEELASRGGRRVLVFMTDGKNTLTARPTDGGLVANGSTSLPVDWRDGSKTIDLVKTLCSNIRAKKITIYTILFDTNDPSTQNLLKECVGELDKPDSTPASERHFFYAKDKQSLADVFDAISKQRMRISG